MPDAPVTVEFPGSAGGSPEEPGVVEFTGSAAATVNAHLDTALADTANDTRWTSVVPGRLGNLTSVQYAPTTTLAALAAVVVTGRAIVAWFRELIEIGAAELNWAAGVRFRKTLTGNTTFTFANVVTGKTIELFLSQNTGQSWGVNWPVGITWAAGAPGVVAAATTTKVTLTATGASTFDGSFLTAQPVVLTTDVNAIKTLAGASEECLALATVEDLGGNDGTGMMKTMAATFLSGGTGGLPLPPVTVEP